ESQTSPPQCPGQHLGPAGTHLDPEGAGEILDLVWDWELSLCLGKAPTPLGCRGHMQRKKYSGSNRKSCSKNQEWPSQGEVPGN
ncbi:hypothetical protein HGM15179_016086, partial [Zosterops borbonicus]